MSMDKVFGIAGSALAAQLVRMNTTASNLANASNTAATAEGAYKAKRAVFRTLLEDQTDGDQTRYAGSLQVANISDDPTPPPRSYDPGNPSADADGYIYRNNIEVINTAKQMMMRTLEVMKS